ncbi:sigma-70 family RNA polymerase sigma factor [Solirubrobacter phytolaccae]|uniref:Sigma-70 family RNA polymerase sigma factor n=1 Tax=Solirubrobacter phytolaccae TaxID=1404360 RepID=A0A9X3SAU4_9ACTN|nr:sigma-70 family RNA polymerase sigma factor [Solirubrobacter phytolaccae]MDA0184068.1 sigma-70 family RNA polymerase sigma factor [Solirubrobacter phytolaccae]
MDDERLVREVERSADAFVELYRRYEQPVLGYFRRRVDDAELAADLTGEVFARALEGLRARRDIDRGFSAWLFGIAHNVLVDSYRRGRVDDEARRRLGMEPVALVDDALARIDALGDETTLRGALDALPPEQREALWARIVDERDYEEIAGALVCSEQVVRKRVSRGLATLRARLGGECQ